jgi:hypothetical protein
MVTEDGWFQHTDSYNKYYCVWRHISGAKVELTSWGTWTYNRASGKLDTDNYTRLCNPQADGFTERLVDAFEAVLLDSSQFDYKARMQHENG